MCSAEPCAACLAEHVLSNTPAPILTPLPLAHPPTHLPPLTAVDASDDSFRFYSGGIYSNPSCATHPADLDHAVIIR